LDAEKLIFLPSQLAWFKKKQTSHHWSP